MGVVRGSRHALLAATTLALPAPPAHAQHEPDAVEVEWQGRRLCEVLHEDAQIRVLRCVFPPGAVHVRHAHPSVVSITVSGGRVRVDSQAGRSEVELPTGRAAVNAPVRWHEVTNIGETTITQVLVERRYAPIPDAARGQ